MKNFTQISKILTSMVKNAPLNCFSPKKTGHFCEKVEKVQKSQDYLKQHSGALFSKVSLYFLDMYV
jgi:hypothetical protein